MGSPGGDLHLSCPSRHGDARHATEAPHGCRSCGERPELALRLEFRPRNSQDACITLKQHPSLPPQPGHEDRWQAQGKQQTLESALDGASTKSPGSKHLDPSGVFKASRM